MGSRPGQVIPKTFIIKAPTRWHCVTFHVQAFAQSLRDNGAPDFHNDRYNILSDILTEFEVNLGIIFEKYYKT